MVSFSLIQMTHKPSRNVSNNLRTKGAGNRRGAALQKPHWIGVGIAPLLLSGSWLKVPGHETKESFYFPFLSFQKARVSAMRSTLNAEAQGRGFRHTNR